MRVVPFLILATLVLSAPLVTASPGSSDGQPSGDAGGRNQTAPPSNGNSTAGPSTNPQDPGHEGPVQCVAAATATYSGWLETHIPPDPTGLAGASVIYVNALVACANFTGVLVTCTVDGNWATATWLTPSVDVHQILTGSQFSVTLPAGKSQFGHLIEERVTIKANANGAAYC